MHFKIEFAIYKTVTVPDYMWDFERKGLKSEYQGSIIYGEKNNAHFIMIGENIERYGGLIIEDHFYIYDNATGEKIIDEVDFRRDKGLLLHTTDGIGQGSGGIRCLIEKLSTFRQLPEDFSIVQQQQMNLYLQNKSKAFHQFAIRPESDSTEQIDTIQ